jgi:putative phosphoribosyl transferase
MTATLFADRRAAGRALAEVLARKHLVDPVVLALPRGGVAVAAEIAAALRAPLDIVLVRKIGVPYQPELAAAAVVDGGDPEVVTNEDVVELAGVAAADIRAGVARELEEIERRRGVYLQGRPRVPLEGRTLVLVDDGIATGASVRAALKALRRKGPRALILAVPVAPAETLDALASEVDEIVCLSTPEPFLAIGIHYADFHQMSDAEVVELLAAQRDEGGGAPQDAAAHPAAVASDSEKTAR